MRLLYLSADPGVPVFGHKGASVHVRELVRALTLEGARMVIASPRVRPEGDSLDVAVDLLGIPAVAASEHARAASLRAAGQRQAEELLRLARPLGLEGIYERYSLYSFAGTHLAGSLDLPYVLEVNAPLRDEARRFRSLLHPAVAAEVEARVYSSADRIYAVSRPLADLLARETDETKVRILRNGASAHSVRRQRGVGNHFTVGFAGSLKPWHGIEVLVEAVSVAAAEIPGLRLEIVGEGPQAHILERVRLPQGRFKSYGARPHGETLQILACWDVGLAPYVAASPTFYFSPLKIGEYMAAGICPVASDLGEIRTLLKDGECGVLVPPGDAEALASALVELAGDRARLSRLAACAQRRALASLSWRHNARVVTGYLRSLQLQRRTYAHAVA